MTTSIIIIPTEKLAELIVRKLESIYDPKVRSLDCLVDLIESVLKEEGIVGFTGKVTCEVLNFLHENGFIKFHQFCIGPSEIIRPWFKFTPNKKSEANPEG